MKRVATLIFFAMIAAISPTGRADECFCLTHSTGAILRGCEAYKAPTDFYSTAVCTDPEIRQEIGADYAFRLEAHRGRR